LKSDEPLTQTEVSDLRALAVSLLLQLDQLDHRVRVLRWWLLTEAVLLLTLTVIVWRLR
jgi:hypothetical protein